MRPIAATFAFAWLLIASTTANADGSEMTAGDLQQICTDSKAESKAACSFYILGVVQGVDMGMSIADGKTRGGRPCVPESTPGSALDRKSVV